MLPLLLYFITVPLKAHLSSRISCLALNLKKKIARHTKKQKKRQFEETGQELEPELDRAEMLKLSDQKIRTTQIRRPLLQISGLN